MGCLGGSLGSRFWVPGIEPAQQGYSFSLSCPPPRPPPVISLSLSLSVKWMNKILKNYPKEEN